MADANSIAVLHNLKVPEKMSAGRALRDFLISQSETDHSSAGLEQRLEVNRQLMALLLGSHLEVVQFIGALEECVKNLAQHTDKQ